MLHVLGGDFRIKGRCPNLEISLLLLKNGRKCNYPWTLTNWWYCIQISVFRVHFSHSFKVWGNSIRIESSKNLGLGISTCLPFRWLWGFQFECLNTTRPRLWVQNFESSFKSSCYDFNKKICSSCNQSGTERRSTLLTAIWTSATDIHLWGSNWENSRNVKSNMSTISFHNMDASKFYLWAKYMYNINMNHDF